MNDFLIRMGVPEMELFWNTLKDKVANNQATTDEIKLYKKFGKALYLISKNPKHPGLNTHEITQLSYRYGDRVWQSYLENNTPAAGRIYWVYGPDRMDITIIGLEPHPNDTKNAYDKITLSAKGKEE